MRQIWIDGEHTDFVQNDDPPEFHVETGGVRFDEDWPGYFMRGDDALFIASLISSLWTNAGDDAPGELVRLKVYADEIFAEVPYKQWINEEGHSIISPQAGPDISVDRSGNIEREEDDNGENDSDV